MSWICKQCETLNADDVIECEVCNSVSPHLSRFDYEAIGSNSITRLQWKAECCDNVKLIISGHVSDVSHLNSVHISPKSDTQITFILENNVAKRKYTYDIGEHNHSTREILKINETRKLKTSDEIRRRSSEISGKTTIWKLSREHTNVAVKAWLKLYCDEEDKWNWAQKEGTINAFETYIASYANGKYCKQAKEEIRRLKEKRTENIRSCIIFLLLIFVALSPAVYVFIF